MNCACCLKPLAPHAERVHPQGYCDVVCYAAHAALTEFGLMIWRSQWRKLDVSPTRVVI